MLSRLSAAVAEVNQALANFEFNAYAQTVYDLLWRDFCDWYLEAIKPTIAQDAGQRAVLAATLDTILRLLHPIMPYVTEAIYEHVRTIDAGAVAGVTLGAARKGELLATAPWPKVDASLRDERAEAEFELVRDLVTTIREARAASQVPPKASVGASLPDGLRLSLSDTQLRLIGHLAGVRTDGTAAAAGDAVESTRVQIPWKTHELVLFGAWGVDSGAEKGRLTKLIADLEKSVSTFEGRLANPGYALKAPPAMVQQTKDQLDKSRSELGAARKALEALGS
jgi:valyl-tRNA synthetase